MRKDKSANKKSYIFIVLVIILAILLVSSRTCRLTRRNLNHSGIASEKNHQKNHDSLIIQKEEPMPEISYPDKNILLGKFSTSQRDSLLSPIERKYANRDGMLMHRDAYRAFQEMHNAAKEDGIELIIISAFRDFNHQKRIWDNKWTGQQVLSGNIYATDISNPVYRAREILRFSAMPGTSRHHWGTDIDLNSLNNRYFESGTGKREYEWLVDNASKFGFCQPYTPKDAGRESGYEEEKWHWSYTPVSADYLNYYARLVTYEDIIGFNGWETARMLNVIENYVLTVNEDCLNL
jgi:LAS superfamily LD-carboxypeptidase LdcB